jgi:hypothetical protein
LPVKFRSGLVPNDPSKPRARVGALLSGTAPAAVDNYSKVPSFPMLGNDLWGDCTFAADGHIIEQQTWFGRGFEGLVTTADALHAYSVVGGFDENAGPPGENPTDNGAQVQDALNYLRKQGFHARKIAAFAELDVADMNKIKLATAEFGCLSIGFNFPKSAMDQFNAGEPWTVVNGSPLDGGHCVVVAGYDANWIYVVTWGAIQRMSYGFWAKYVDEAWAVISLAWAHIDSATHVDKATLGQEFTALTGEPSPW